jgi:copper(I)-binding protein
MHHSRFSGALAWTPYSLFALILAVVCVPAARAQTPQLMVKNAWARTPLAPQNNTAVYLTLENPSGTSRSVVSITTPDAARAELHEARMQGSLMTMRSVKEITIPAKGHFELKPGGYHIMVFAVKKPVQPGGQIHLVLKLNDGASVPVAATVLAADATPPTTSGGGKR